MVFNIEYGGTLVSFKNVVEAIRLSGAQVVAIEEAYGNLDSLARALGWANTDRRTHVISRSPLVAIRGAQGTDLTLVELSPGCVVAVANVHLPSDSSADELERLGWSQGRILALERRLRLPALQPVLADLAPLIARGIPAFLAGDFNAPSHRDDGVGWPTSLAAESAGFRDSYREVYPDARAHPGFTWWAGRPKVSGWNPDPKDAQMRINLLYATAAARATASGLVGEGGARDVTITVEPWVSDHRAIVTTFDVQPAPAPPLVVVPHQRAIQGGDVTIQVHSAERGARLRFKGVGSVSGATALEVNIRASGAIDTVRVSTRDLNRGAWDVQLLSSSGAIQARARFWLTAPDARPGVGTSKRKFRAGEAIVAHWHDAPGNRWDWVGVYVARADLADPNPLLWRHTGSTVAGSAVLDQAAEGGGWPLRPGVYRVALGLDDSYAVLAESLFEVVP